MDGAPARGSNVLIEMPGEEFNGVLGCDYFSAYRKYMKDFSVEVQFCLAHLIREVKFLIGLPHERARVYGERLLDALRELFSIIHRRETMTPRGFQRALEKARTDVINAATWAPRCSPAKEPRNNKFHKFLAKRACLSGFRNANCVHYSCLRPKEPSQALSPPRRRLLPLHHHAGRRTDQ